MTLKKVCDIFRNVYVKICKILAKFLIFMINIYRRYFSPLKKTCHCRYIPTCSQYAMGAIEKYGPFKGTYLALKRILRCNPFSKGGCDPVP